MGATFDRKGLAPEFALALGANLANSGSVFLATLLLIRALPQSDFGWIGIGLAYAFVLAKVLDAGVTFTALRFGARHLESGEGSAYLGAMYAVISLLALVALISLPLLSLPIFSGLDSIQKGSGFWPATIGTAWAIALQAALRSDFQARRRYGLLFASSLLTALCRLGVALGFWLALLPPDRLTAYLSLYLLPVGLATLLCLPLVGRGLFAFWSRRGTWRALLRGLFSYAPWVWLSGTLFVLTLRGPVFALERLGQSSEVAMLTAALSFVSLVALANDAARAVLLPRSVQFRTPGEFRSYIDRMDHLVPRIFLAALPLLLFAAVVIQPLLPPGYLPNTLYTFIILAAAVLATALLGTVTNLIHALGQPFSEAMLNLARALLVISGCWLLARYLGAGITLLCLYAGVVVVIFEMVFSAYVRYKIGTLSNQPVPPS